MFFFAMLCHYNFDTIEDKFFYKRPLKTWALIYLVRVIGVKNIVTILASRTISTIKFA